MNRDGARWSAPLPTDPPPTLADGVDLVDLIDRPVLALVGGRWLRVRLVRVDLAAGARPSRDVALVVEGRVER